jgi:hypothetical protein
MPPLSSSRSLALALCLPHSTTNTANERTTTNFTSNSISTSKTQYPGNGGYIIDLPADEAARAKTILQAKAAGFISYSTRAVFADYSVYFPARYVSGCVHQLLLLPPPRASSCSRSAALKLTPLSTSSPAASNYFSAVRVVWELSSTGGVYTTFDAEVLR